jgi:hypothetical protein
MREKVIASGTWARKVAVAVLALAAGCGGGSSNGTGGTGGGTGGGAGTGGAGGSGGAGGTGGSAMASFDRDIQKPIFNALCVDCHFTGTPNQYDLSKPFDPAGGIINRANSWLDHGSKEPVVVEPGNVANSFLIKKVADPNFDTSLNGKPMPLHLPRLSQTELDAVSKWITDGAKNDEYFGANVAPIFGTQLRLGFAGGRCTFCHYPNAPSGMNVLAVFDATTGMVGRASRYGAGMKIVDPGNPTNSSLMKKLSGTTLGDQMPLHRPRLTEAQVETLRKWITAGAPNN